MKSISHSQAATCLSYREKFKKNAGSWNWTLSYQENFSVIIRYTESAPVGWKKSCDYFQSIRMLKFQHSRHHV